MSGHRSYNLLDKPWIPVVWSADAPEPRKPKIGIREAFARAHEIDCITHTAPFIEFGLYRLLITIVLDAYIVAGQRPTIGTMQEMMAAEQFGGLVVDAYLDSHANRFDLWAADYPFLQRSVDTNEKPRNKSTKPIVAMFAAIPSGTNVTHWHHVPEDDIAVGEDIAAQFLTAVSPWNFKVKPDEARTLAGDPPMYALVLGRNLFETIVLNLPRPSGRSAAKQEKDNGPAWRTALALDKLPKSPTIAQGYTWPVRIIALENDGAMIAKAVNRAAYRKPTDKAKANAKNSTLYEARGWRDPNAGTVASQDGVDHIKARPSVPVWRDAVPLFLVASEGEALRGEKRRSRPEVVSNALRVLDTPRFRVAVYGMRKKSGGGGDVKLEEWFRSVLTLPAEVARDSRLSARAMGAFVRAQRVADALRTALRMLRPPMDAVPRERKKLNEQRRAESDAINAYWQALEPVLVGSYLDELAKGDSAAEEELSNRLRGEAKAAFRRATGPLRRDADGLFRIANADHWLARRLATLLRRETNT